VERRWQVKLHGTPFVTESLELDLSSFWWYGRFERQVSFLSLHQYRFRNQSADSASSYNFFSIFQFNFFDSYSNRFNKIIIINYYL
jgi:hypothetical protein